MNNLNGILSFDQINYLFSHFHSFSESQYLLLLGLKEFIPSDLNLAMELLCVSSPDFSNVQHFDEDNLAYTPKPIQQSPLSYGQMPQIKQEVPLKLRIVTQPPEFIISKRNINKDNAFPTVEVIGQFARDENIQYGLQVKFIQCDTRIEFPERLDIGLKDVNGNPLDITRSLIKFEASKVLTFNKLKVTETSTKNDDSLYFLQFILFEVDTRTTQRREIDSVSSTAFKVFTHVSQINKLYIGTEPIIKELLPLYANPYGTFFSSLCSSSFHSTFIFDFSYL